MNLHNPYTLRPSSTHLFRGPVAPPECVRSVRGTLRFPLTKVFNETEHLSLGLAVDTYTSQVVKPMDNNKEAEGFIDSLILLLGVTEDDGKR